MRRRWIGLLAVLALVGVHPAQAIDFDPNEVYDLVEPAPRTGWTVRIVDARDTPSAAAQILSDGIRLGETQFRQPPPEALRQSLESYLNSTLAQARPRELLTRGSIRLTRFDMRFVQAGLLGEAGRAGIPGGEAVDLLFRSLAKGKAGAANGIVRIEVEAGGRLYAGNASGKLTAAPTSATTRAAFQSAVDDLVKAMSADPDTAAAPFEPQASSSKRRR
jgi:hypothetical protein